MRGNPPCAEFSIRSRCIRSLWRHVERDSLERSIVWVSSTMRTWCSTLKYYEYRIITTVRSRITNVVCKIVTKTVLLNVTKYLTRASRSNTGTLATRWIHHSDRDFKVTSWSPETLRSCTNRWYDVCLQWVEMIKSYSR